MRPGASGDPCRFPSGGSHSCSKSVHDIGKSRVAAGGADHVATWDCAWLGDLPHFLEEKTNERIPFGLAPSGRAAFALPISL